MKSALNRILIVLPLLLFAVTSCKDDDEQPIPQAISISPNAGLPGSTAIIQGAQFSAEKSDNVVTFNGKIASINQATAVQLDVVVPADAGTGPVAVVISVKGKVASSQLIYSVLPLNTTVTSIAPMKGGFNTLVTITGSNFDAVAVNNIVTFNGVQGTVQSATATSLTVRVPAKAGTGAVVVNGSTPGPTFTYTPEIYVVGYEGQAGKYWKNGVAIPWSLPGKYVYFTGIAVVGNDVHVSGTEIKKNGSWVATYWK
ncbi:MAG TPA: IPT/TIG domain-containing protein, partial [Chryseolinea sp.]|nr:IPT/TIG domain-containing protein [Chryseolinea sp.]